MRVLVVYCHPVPESFCAAIRDATLLGLAKAGHEIDLLDLYAEGFDPVMPADERRRYNSMNSSKDNPYPGHVERLAWAEALVFVYPTWWYGLPAMLKGWLDRVWTPGVAFDIATQGGVITSKMGHVRKLGVVTTCGAPRWWSYYVGHPGKRTLTRGMRALFARRCKTVFMAQYLMDTAKPEELQAWLVRVESRFSRF